MLKHSLRPGILNLKGLLLLSAGTSDGAPPHQQKPQTPPKHAPKRAPANKMRRRTKMRRTAEPSHHIAQVRM